LVLNILTDRLPQAIRVNGQVYEINSNFRDCLRIIMAFEDNDLTRYEKQLVLLSNLYKDVPAEADAKEAAEKAVKFLNGGEEESEGSMTSNMRLFSFTKDARFIFSAFQQTHGIDLQHTEYLHWWQFITLFMDLGADTMFCNLVGLRKRVKTGKASREEKRVAREMGSIFDVPDIDDRSIEEKEQDREFVRLVEEARKRKKEARQNARL
jgi:hypothetical protein